jgi:general secretion pathway protein G
MKRREHPGGFTLIELLLVVIIIGILAAIVVPRLVGRAEDAKIAAAQGNLRVLREALNRFELDNGEFPDTLDELVIRPADDSTKWKGPYIDAKAIPRDPWGNEFVYVFPGAENPEMFDLRSIGKDNSDGTEDDIDAYATDDAGENTE